MHKKFWGEVVHGLGNGKDFGFPTANIKLIDNTIEIQNGVYAVSVCIHNQTFKGMLYVGTRPTLQLFEKTIEIHIFDFNGVLYNQQISFNIWHKMRDEITFTNTNALVEQLHQDKEIVKNYFQNQIFQESSLISC